MARILSRIHYPRLSLLVIIFLISYLLIYGRPHDELHAFLLSLGYAGIFFSGIFYAYGFTAGPATLVLLSLAKDQNLLVAGMIGGVGALIGDLIIFFFVRKTFAGELDMLSRNQLVKRVEKGERRLFGHFQRYVLPAFASFFIASPLPTEIGVTLMASRRHLSTKAFAVIAYLLHTTGISLILLVGQAL